MPVIQIKDDPHRKDLTPYLGRIFMIGFGAFFTCFSLAGLAAGFAQHSAFGTLIGLAMTASGLWLVIGGLIWVRIVPNHSVGGGPMFTRVRLEPGEIVEQHTGGMYSQDSSGPRKQPFFSGNFTGELVLTDRRFIFLPMRFRYPAKPGWFGYSDIVAAERSPGVTLANLNGDSLRIETRDGTSHFVSSLSSEMRQALLALPSRSGTAPEHRSSGGAPDEPIAVVIALSVIGLLAVGAFLFGQASWPFVHSPESWTFVVIFGLGVAVGVWQIWHRVHQTRRNHERDNSA